MSRDSAVEAGRGGGSPSVFVFPTDRAQGETIQDALAQHDISVTLKYDLTTALEELRTRDIDCVLALTAVSTLTSAELLERIREREPLLPVFFLRTDPDEDLSPAVTADASVETVVGGIDSLSYGDLAERIRVAVSEYRSMRARDSERDVVSRLEARIQETERKITALHSVAMELSTLQEESAVFERTVAAAEDILALDICFVFGVEDDQFVPKAQSSTPTEETLRPIPLDSGMMGETYRTGESARTVDMELHALAEPAFGEYKSGISVPIGDCGVFQAVSTETGAFDAIDLELTELLMAHTTSALQRLEYETALRHERDHYAALFENSTDCIVEAEFVGDDSIIRSVNPAFEDVFGYDESEVVGEPIDDVVVTEERREEAEALTQQVYTGEFVKAEVRRHTRDGPKDFLLRSVPLSDDTMYAVYTEITERRERERELERQNERLQEFAGVLTHDLRNPLNVAQGHLELEADERESDHLEAAQNALTRMETLINDMLSLAKAGGSVGETEPVEIGDIIESCWQNVQTESATLDSKTEQVIEADRSRLQQLLENLFRNSVEHGGDDVTITVGDLPHGFYIQDDGPGIPIEDHERILEPGVSTSQTGTGFGLSIVRDIAAAHDWTLTITTSTEGGARFELTDVTIVD